MGYFVIGIFLIVLAGAAWYWGDPAKAARSFDPEDDE